MRLHSRPVKREPSQRVMLSVLAAGVVLAIITVVAVSLSGDEVVETAASGQHGDHARGGSAVVNGRVAQLQAGPMTQIDEIFLVKVRQAGLWEIPAGRMAQTKATSEAVKRAGLHLLDGHSELDQLVREDARILGVALPNDPTEEQQGWLAQMNAVEGAEFDRLFANLLRNSHGKIFATIAEVRASTQNDLIRRHARQANQTVLDHMEVLEDTGLVDQATFADVEAAVTPK